jgi:hypothetical protein
VELSSERSAAYARTKEITRDVVKPPGLSPESAKWHDRKASAIAPKSIAAYALNQSKSISYI